MIYLTSPRDSRALGSHLRVRSLISGYQAPPIHGIYYCSVISDLRMHVRVYMREYIFNVHAFLCYCPLQIGLGSEKMETLRTERNMKERDSLSFSPLPFEKREKNSPLIPCDAGAAPSTPFSLSFSLPFSIFCSSFTSSYLMLKNAWE